MIKHTYPFQNSHIFASSRQIEPTQYWLETNNASFQAFFPPSSGIHEDFALHMLRIPPTRQATQPHRVVGGKAQQCLVSLLRLTLRNATLQTRVGKLRALVTGCTLHWVRLPSGQSATTLSARSDRADFSTACIFAS